ncbi:LysR family transcriptional regulator [Herbaspirillum autotrophicum]|uniref:LysR family transcriptional regulator n=1 Tax=Herbaspirillum autotrophicum TaxID=180195 RepID=UPI00067B8B1D|nr:LysR family transcriptional regulator [Herbaspirillum autotrophicum]
MHATVLKYFVEVARCGSIRKAAQHLFVASSAVNRQILKLEEELGSELFDRLPNGIRLNSAGERVLQHVQSTLQDFHVVRTELDAIKGERSGHISIAAMDSLFVEFLPAAVEEFSGFFPAVTYSIFAMSPGEVPERVASGEFDIGICFTGKIPVGLEVVASADFPPGVVMAASHPLASKAEISYADCAGYSFLTSGGVSPFHGVVSNEFTEFLDSLTSRISCNATEMLKRMIVAGRGISIFSQIGFMPEIARGEAVWRPLAQPAVRKLQVAIVIPRHRALTHVTQQFVARQVKRLRQLELTSQMY